MCCNSRFKSTFEHYLEDSSVGLVFQKNLGSLKAHEFMHYFGKVWGRLIRFILFKGEPRRANFDFCFHTSLHFYTSVPWGRDASFPSFVSQFDGKTKMSKRIEKKTKTSSLSLRRWLVGIQETVKAQRSVSKMSWWVKTTLLSSFPAPAFLEPHTHITHEAQGSSWQQRVPCQAQLVLNLRWNRNVGNFDLLSVSLTRDTNST